MAVDNEQTRKRNRSNQWQFAWRHLLTTKVKLLYTKSDVKQTFEPVSSPRGLLEQCKDLIIILCFERNLQAPSLQSFDFDHLVIQYHSGVHKCFINQKYLFVKTVLLVSWKFLRKFTLHIRYWVYCWVRGWVDS